MNPISTKNVKRRIITPKMCLIMKISLFLLVCCVTSAFSNPSYSQTINLNLNLKNVSVGEVLDKIEDQSDFRFLYNKETVDVDRKVSISSDNENIESVLGELFSENDVAYSIHDRQVVLAEKSETEDGEKVEKIELQTTPPLKGIIKDKTGEPLIGVSISVKESNAKAITDVDGSFSISATAGQTIVVSYLGYTTQEIAVTSSREVNIVMDEVSQELGAVVVVGFGTQKKESITGAISAISGKDLMTTNASTTSTALAGKIAGINSRQADGRPGYGTSLRIRGMGAPLYVIDGVQKDEGQFNNIDPNDIESISILKDASAAIYGVRAGNGVIVVKTKSGSLETKNTVNINASYGWQTYFRFPKPADTETYVTTKYQSDVIKKASDPKFNPKYTKEDYEKWMTGTEKGYLGWDWYDYVVQNSPQSYVGGNVSGGSENINYYLSLGHLTQEAILKNYGGFYRTNVQMNVDAKVTSKLKLGASVNGRIERKKNPGVPGTDDYWTALFAIYRNLPTVRPYANDNPLYPAKTSTNNSTNFAILNYDISGTYEDIWRVMQLNLSAEYQIIDGLKLNLLGGYYLADRTLNNHEYTYKLYEYDEANDDYKIIDRMDNPYMERTYAKVEETSGSFNLDFNRKFGSHNLAAMVGGEFIERKTPSFWLNDRPAANPIDQVFLTSIVGMSDVLQSPEARAGFMARANYDYAGKYLLELIGRYDGAWKFPEDDRWGFFPSVSAGWRVSEEAFWEPFRDKVSNLKFKISYGSVGLDTTSGYNPFDYLGGYTYNNGGAVLDGKYVVGTKPRGIPVKTLSWMEAKMFNVGLEAGFLDDRLNVDVNYFTRKLDGIPEGRYDVLIPTEVGFNAPNENLRSEMLKGVDGSLTWSDNVSDFNYSLSSNFTFARRYDWHQYKPRFGNSWHEYRNSIHERYGNVNWGYQTVGQFQSWEEIANYPVNVDGKGNTTLRPGDLIYKDVNADGIINSMDERPIGYREGDVPYLNYNFVLNFDYKGFDLGLTFGGSTFASFFLNWEMRNPLHDGGNNPQYYLSNQWRLSDIHDANSPLIAGKYPTIIEGNASHSNYWKNDFWLRNVSYLKLRNLELGYTIPKTVTQRLGMEKARVYTSMQNLFSLDNLGDIDMDPEITSGSGLQYPTTRMISFGVNLTF